MSMNRKKQARQSAGLLHCTIKKVPRTGLEPVRAISPRDFKSLVSTNSTISAQDEKK